MSLAMMETIHWAAIDRAYKKMPLQNKLAIFNLMHQKWPTHMTVARWDCEKNPICSRCNSYDETFAHVFQCKSKHADNSHKDAVKKLRDSLRRAQTAPIIQRAIIQSVEIHRKGYENLSFNDVIVPDNNKTLARKVFCQ